VSSDELMPFGEIYDFGIEVPLIQQYDEKNEVVRSSFKVLVLRHLGGHQGVQCSEAGTGQQTPQQIHESLRCDSKRRKANVGYGV